MGGSVKLRKLRNGTTTITGLTDGDLRLIANVLESGSYEGADRGGPVSRAVLRLAAAIRVPASFGYPIGHVEIHSGLADADRLYEEL
jgi:hypothetical protein